MLLPIRIIKRLIKACVFSVGVILLSALSFLLLGVLLFMLKHVGQSVAAYFGWDQVACTMILIICSILFIGVTVIRFGVLHDRDRYR